MCLINIKKLKSLQQDYRKKYGKITQDELAKKIGISPDNYSKLLRDKTHSPLLETVIKIADFYNSNEYPVSIDWLTDRFGQYHKPEEIELITILREKPFGFIKRLVNIFKHDDNVLLFEIIIELLNNKNKVPIIYNSIIK